MKPFHHSLPARFFGLPLAVLLMGLLLSTAFAQRPGDRQTVAGVHPSYVVTNVRPATGTTATAGTPWPNTGGALSFPIGAMDFMSDGRLVVTSWRDPYEVFIVSNGILGSDPTTATVTKFATGLVESLGLKVVNDSIYVLEKDQLTLLLDHDNDGRADEYRAISYDWTKSVNSKEYAMGLPFDGTWFYAAFGDPTTANATAVDPVPAGRQNGVLRFKKDGTTEVFAAGLRVPGAMSFAFGQPWVTEIQGGYRPSSVVYNPKAGRFYGRPINAPAVFQPANVPIPRADSFPYDSPTLTRSLATPFVLNLPFKNIGTSGAGPVGWQRSPAQLVEIKTGPFAGQMLVSESDNEGSGSGEMVRAFIEQTADGELQGAVFHFTRNAAFAGTTVSGFGRFACMSLVMGPDGNVYCGANGATAAGWSRATSVGLNRLSLSGAEVPFDILALRSTGPNTFEFQFTQPLAASLGTDVSANLVVQRWWDRMSDEYGCCRVGVENPATRSIKSVATMTGFTATVQADRAKVTVTFPAGQLAVNWQYYFRWTDVIRNGSDQTLYGTEAFYTLNAFGPATAPVSVAPRIPAPGAPFNLVVLPDGAVRLRFSLEAGKRYRVTAVGLDGRVTSVRRGQGTGEVLLAAGDLAKGIALLRIETPDRSFARVVSR
jgi:cytochrome c